jgi:hypothetical protein
LELTFVCGDISRGRGGNAGRRAGETSCDSRIFSSERTEKLESSHGFEPSGKGKWKQHVLEINDHGIEGSHANFTNFLDSDQEIRTRIVETPPEPVDEGLHGTRHFAKEVVKSIKLQAENVKSLRLEH